MADDGQIHHDDCDHNTLYLSGEAEDFDGIIFLVVPMELLTRLLFDRISA